MTLNRLFCKTNFSSRRNIIRGRIVLITALSYLLLFVSDIRGAKYAGEFLAIGLGGRAAGMGGAFCALADDGSGFYWNPAGYAHVYTLQFSGMYAPMYGNPGAALANYHHLGVSMPISGITLGLNWIRFSVSDIPRYPDYTALDFITRRSLIQNANGQPQGYFSDTEDAVFLTIARMNRWKIDFGWEFFEMPIEVPMGLNLKMIRQSLAGYSSFGIGADFGMQFRVELAEPLSVKWLGSLCAAFNYQDFSKTGINWGNNNSDAIPPNFKYGFGFTQRIALIDSEFNLGVDFDKRWTREAHYGFEFIFHKSLSFRMGYEMHGWTVGLGGKYKQFVFDYAFINTDLGQVNRISGSYILE